MKICRFLTFLALLLAVLLPAAALADNAAANADAAAGNKMTAEESYDDSGDEAVVTSQENRGETALAEPEIEIIPNPLAWLTQGFTPACIEQCSSCPSETCEFNCLLLCPRFFGCSQGLACCGLEGSGFPGC